MNQVAHVARRPVGSAGRLSFTMTSLGAAAAAILALSGSPAAADGLSVSHSGGLNVDASARVGGIHAGADVNTASATSVSATRTQSDASSETSDDTGAANQTTARAASDTTAAASTATSVAKGDDEDVPIITTGTAVNAATDGNVVIDHPTNERTTN